MLAFWCVVVAVSLRGIPPAAAEAPAAEVLTHARRHFLKIETQKGVIRVTRPGESKKARFAFRFFYQKPDKFRKEFLPPLDEQILTDGKTLWNYQPSRRVVVKKELASLAEQERRLLGITPGFGIDLLAKVPPSEYDYQLVTSAQGRFVLSAVPRENAPPLTPKEITVEARRWVLLSFKHHLPQGGVVEAVFSDYQKFLDDIWFPLKIHTRLLPQGQTLEETAFSNIEINVPLPPGIFAFKPPAGVKQLP